MRNNIQIRLSGMRSGFLLLIVAGLLVALPVMAASYQPAVGSRIELIKPLTISSGVASVYIQKNISTSNGALINQYHANCSFEQHDLAVTDRVIAPTQFSVTRSLLITDYPTRGQSEFRTVFYLQADKTAENFVLECRHWGEWGDDHLSQGEIQAALIEYFLLK